MMNHHDTVKKETPEPWLCIIGIGEDGLSGLGTAAVRALEEADFIFGGARHLAMLDHEGAEQFLCGRIVWPTPFMDGINQISKLRGHKVAVLASGDPMFFGVGATLARKFASSEMVIFPHASSFSYAAARLGWALQDVICVSAHAHPMSSVLRYVEEGAKLLILANGGESPQQLAQLLDARGFGESLFYVMEHLGGKLENIIKTTAQNLGMKTFADLNVIAVACHTKDSSRNYARHCVLPDHAFISDGLLTKQNIRAITLTHLGPRKGECLWDVGAGCGSIAIEWLRLGDKTRAIAIEENAQRCANIRTNADFLGTPDLQLINGHAPEALAGLDRPDAVFIGGGFSASDVVEACWQALKPGGRLVANAVTVESETAVTAFAALHGGELLRLDVGKAEPLGQFHVWRQALPITMLIAKKSLNF